NVAMFSKYVAGRLQNAQAKFGFGGYNELRTLYNGIDMFGNNSSGQLDAEEPRSLHLGIDIWGDADTGIFAPWEATVHSFAFNNNFGDYGATIILSHQLEGLPFFTLYGHLALADLQRIREGSHI